MGVFVPSPQGQFILRQTGLRSSPTTQAFTTCDFVSGGTQSFPIRQPTTAPDSCDTYIAVDANAEPRKPVHITSGIRPPQGSVPRVLDEQVYPVVIDKLRAIASARSPMRAAWAHLSWMPHTEFGKRAGDSTVLYAAGVTADWAVFAAGLVIGIACIPLLYPLFRCEWAYNEVRRLERAVGSLELAQELLSRARTITVWNEETAWQFLHIFRAQACEVKLLSVSHHSAWSQIAEDELLDFLSTKVPNFYLKVRAADATANYKAGLAHAALWAAYLTSLATRKSEDGTALPADDWQLQRLFGFAHQVI